MKNRIKKISSLFFLLAASMPLLFTLFFLIRQQLIRHEMQEKLEEEMLHTIKVPEAEVQWIRSKKEVRLDGKMFDIKSFYVKNGEYVFTGLYDEEETALNNYFEKNTDQNKAATNQMLSSLFKLFQSVFTNDLIETMGLVDGPLTFCPLILTYNSPPFKEILTPPPQLVFT